MPSPPAFAVHFHMHVWPDLAERAKVNATLIVCGLLTFAEGSDELMQIAVQRGATYLPDQDELHNRLMTLLAAETDKARALAETIRAFAEDSPSAFWRRIWNPK